MSAEILHNLPYSEYAKIDAASASRLKVLRDHSPLHLRHAIDHPEDPTPDLILGNALHTYMLERDEFDVRYVVAAQCSSVVKKTGEACDHPGKVLVDGQWLCGVHGKGKTPDRSTRTVLSPEQHLQVLGMARSYSMHTYCRLVLDRMEHTEITVVWTDEATGCRCKARLDGSLDGGILDLKTTQDAGRDAFSRSMRTFGYDLQADHYLAAAAAAGLPAEHFFFLPVEKEAPFASAVYRISDRNLLAVREERRELLATYHQCQQTKKWPGYGVEDIEIPEWALKKLELAI